MGNGYLVTLSYTEQKTTQKIPQKKTKDRIIALMTENSIITISLLFNESGVGRDKVNEPNLLGVDHVHSGISGRITNAYTRYHYSMGEITLGCTPVLLRHELL